jgi:DNA-directed RNA polymerase subunit RPC12/RpoP
MDIKRELRNAIERYKDKFVCTGEIRIDVMAADCLCKIEELEAESARLEQWVNDLQSGMYVNCVYCGHRYGPSETTPVSMAEVLKQHIEQCPEHPMSALKRENERLQYENEGLRANAAIQESIIENNSNPLDKEKIVRLTMDNARLQSELSRQTERAERAEKRAEAAIEDLNILRKKSGWKCFACKYDVQYIREVCAGCEYNNDNNWQWRGEENKGEA